MKLEICVHSTYHWIDVTCREIFFGQGNSCSVSIKFQHEFSGNYCAKISGKMVEFIAILFPWWWRCYCIAFTTKKTDLPCFKPSLHSSFVWHYISVNFNQKQPRWCRLLIFFFALSSSWKTPCPSLYILEPNVILFAYLSSYNRFQCS